MEELIMKKSFLLGLGAAAASAFVISKKLTESQKDRIAMKIDETLLNLRDTAVKYDKYAHDYLDENRDTINNFKQSISDRFNHLKDESVVSDAFSSLKQATSDLKTYIQDSKEDIEQPFENHDEVMQDDIFIDDPNFGEEDELKTVIFFPEGWEEPEKSLDDNNEPQL